MREFWVASGHHLARRDGSGALTVTDELLMAWLARPEVAPPEDACAAERALHARLLAAPRAPVATAEVAAMADPDARENWGHLLGLRDRLIAAGTVEGAYLAMIRGRQAPAPIFLAHLTQLILRNALDGCDDPFTLRAAEMLFRPQKGTVREGAICFADLELVEAIEARRAAAPLAAMLEPDAWADIDVMTPANAWTYWSRSDAHTMALNFGGEPAARLGMAAALAAWIGRLLGVAALVEPVTDARDVDFRWYVGLDADGSALGARLWKGEDGGALAQRLVGLFALRFLDPSVAATALGGAPVWLLMCLGADGTLRLKPQNLVVNLPLRAAA
jgi:hypothetical protein